jgi:nitrate/nitrite transport system ATP-binding protein
MRIALRGVSKRFGASTAVDELSLDIHPGELVALVGGSGCGKTTTLRLIAGFERPDAGEIRFDDRVVNDVPPSRRGVGIVFQSYALFPTMTVAENIAFGLRVARWPQPRIRERVGELLALTHLTGLESRYANQLSGGQQQRVALARALARRPDMLLLDEPLSALDALTRATLQGEIERIWEQDKKTVVLITNDVDEALLLADRIIPLTPGPGATLGESVAVTLARPRDRKPLNHDPEFKRLRARVTQQLLGYGAKRKSTVTRKLILPDILPEDLDAPRTKRRRPLRPHEVKEVASTV